MPRDSGVFGSRRDRLEARCAAADANADAASTGEEIASHVVRFCFHTGDY